LYVLPPINKSVTIRNNVVHSRVNLDLSRVSSVLKSGEPRRHRLLRCIVGLTSFESASYQK